MGEVKPTSAGFWWTRRPGGEWEIVRIESGLSPRYDLYVRHSWSKQAYCYHLDSYYKQNEWHGPILPPEEKE